MVLYDRLRLALQSQKASLAIIEGSISVQTILVRQLLNSIKSRIIFISLSTPPASFGLDKCEQVHFVDLTCSSPPVDQRLTSYKSIDPLSPSILSTLQTLLEAFELPIVCIDSLSSLLMMAQCSSDFQSNSFFNFLNFLRSSTSLLLSNIFKISYWNCIRNVLSNHIQL